MISDASWSPDGKRIAAGGHTEAVTVWNAAGSTLLLTLDGHPESIGGIDWSPDGRRLISVDWSGDARVWNADTGQLLVNFSIGAYYDNRDVEWSPDGTLVALSGCVDDNTAWLGAWDPDDGRAVWHTTFPKSGCMYYLVFGMSPSFSSDSRLVLQPGNGTGCSAFDATTGAPVRITTDYPCGYWSPDGTHVANNTGIWDATSGRLIYALEADQMFRTWSPDGYFFVTQQGYAPSIVHVHSVKNGQTVATFEGQADIMVDVEWTQDGTVLSTAGWDGSVVIWHVRYQP